MMDGTHTFRNILREFHAVFGESAHYDVDIIIGAHYREANPNFEREEGRLRATPKGWFGCFKKAWDEWELNKGHEKKLVMISADNFDLLEAEDVPFLQKLKKDDSVELLLYTNRNTSHFKLTENFAMIEHVMRAETVVDQIMLSMGDYLFKNRSGFSSISLAIRMKIPFIQMEPPKCKRWNPSMYNRKLMNTSE
eukprot:Trichotokara_eunicae@DN6303_c0_g1_i1.p1